MLAPKPIHRSVTFWCGIFVITFVCWLWRDSFSHLSGIWVRTAPSGTGMNISSRTSILTLEHNTSPSAVRGGKLHHYRTRMPVDPKWEVSILPLPAFERGGGFSIDSTGPRPPSFSDVRTHLDLQRRLMTIRPARDWSFMIPHWLILAGVALPWSGALLWRARRNKRNLGQPHEDGSRSI